MNFVVQKCWKLSDMMRKEVQTWYQKEKKLKNKKIFGNGYYAYQKGES